MWDVFISHAWEDKETVARPLAHALSKAGITVWYDEFTLTLGDSLRRSIDRGLAESRYGLVILSPDFFNKGWPQRELDGLTTRETGSGKVILPVLHRLTHTDVEHFSPILADKVSVSTTAGLDIVVREILKAARPEATPTSPEPWPKQFPLRRFISTIRNHLGALAIVFLFIIIIGIGKFTGALDGVLPFVANTLVRRDNLNNTNQRPPVQVGDQVLAMWKDTGCLYQGKVREAQGKSYRIFYTFALEEWVEEKNIFSPLPPTPSQLYPDTKVYVN
jgi:hypothetical protein